MRKKCRIDNGGVYMNLWELFTEESKKIYGLAVSEASAIQAGSVDVEHILLGILRSSSSPAAQILQEYGLNYSNVRNEVYRLSKSSYSSSTSVEEPAPTLKKALEEAYELAQRNRHNYISPEHLLIAILEVDNSSAAQVLKKLGVPIREVLKKVKEKLKIADTTSNGDISTPTLDNFATNLTDLAKKGKLDPVIGRDKEIERTIQILCRRNKNNPVLIGEPGVGKTAIVEGLAQKIVNGEVPEELLNKKIYQLSMGNLLAGAKYRGEFEERMKSIIDEVKRAKDIILFIDELHTVVGAGDAQGGTDAANILKPELARGEIQIIGATTLDEYRKYIEKDPALERRFQPVMVEEPSVEDAIKILQGLKDKYESYHKVKITDEAIRDAVKLSARYITNRYLPDKAIDLLDEAATRVKLQNTDEFAKVKNLEKQLENLKREEEEAIMHEKFELAHQIHWKVKELEAKLEEEKKKWEEARVEKQKSSQVTSNEICNIVEQWTGVPVSTLRNDEAETLKNLEEILKQKIIGQDEAVKLVASAVRRARAGLSDPKRPNASFLFLGPTGVGKTALAKALAEVLFGTEEALIRFDMSEYMEKHAVSKLIGAPPGYVGYEEAGQLTEAVRRRPYCVLLFDEVEKAHPEVFNIFLQILEDGILTDSQGRRVDFRNTYIIMTSNIGADGIYGNIGNIGYKKSEEKSLDYEEMKKNYMNALFKQLKPEFINRIDEIVVFKPLSYEDLEKIVHIMLREVIARLNEKNIKFEITDEAILQLIKLGTDVKLGARPLRRTIQRYIENKLADMIILGELNEGDKVIVDWDGNEFKYIVEKDKNKEEIEKESK